MESCGLDREGLATLQRGRLSDLLRIVLRSNGLYREKLGRAGVASFDDAVRRGVFTTRGEIQEDQQSHPPYGSNLTYGLDRYVRVHETSGSGGRPVRWLDTAESWSWWRHCWSVIYAAAGVRPGDRFAFTFSFGPFIGFWGAFESAAALGHWVMPCGGMTTSARLRYLTGHGATIVCCTPTYALRMAEVAAEEGIDLRGSAVRALIVAGEPGGSIPATRARIEGAWGARVFDHAGMTEVGPWGFECAERPGGLHVMESEFVAEVVDSGTGREVGNGEAGELVLTNLGRLGMPLIRYRTGDQVRLTRDRCACGRWFAWAEGGVLGRIDDMLIVRGNNVFPSAVEGVLRGFDEVAEYRLVEEKSGAMSELRIEIEPAGGSSSHGLSERVAGAVRDQLHFRPMVALVAAGSLPRFEMKGKRVVRGGLEGKTTTD